MGCVSEETFLENVAHSSSLGIPFIQAVEPSRKSLAIVGGGPSIRQSSSRLHGFDDVWGINNAAGWVNQKEGIKAALFTVDPADDASMCEGVERALLSSSVHPKMFEYLEGKDVKLFHSHMVEGFCAGGGPTSACRAPVVALYLGFSSITFFGCEGSYGEQSHAYYNQPRNEMVVRANGQDFVTQPDFYMQCEYLAGLITKHPQVFSEQSGGLLRGMVEDKDWEVVGLGIDLARTLTDGHPEMLPKYELKGCA